MSESAVAGFKTQKAFNTILNEGLPDIEMDIRRKVWGRTGGGGFVIDHGPEIKITHMQWAEDGLRVHLVNDCEYSIFMVTTDEKEKVEAFLRNCSLPCTDTPTFPLQGNKRTSEVLSWLKSLVGL